MAIVADPVFSPADERINQVYNGGVMTKAILSLPKSSSSFLPELSPIEQGVTNMSDGIVYPRLFGTRWEAETISALVNSGDSLTLTDFDANRKRLLTTDLSEYRIVHFATHSVIDKEHPDRSGLILSLVDENGHPQNGFLRVGDIFNLKLSADLVVLSACHSGLGKEMGGEGLIGLTRGFMYAGTSRVVTSLWAVDDKATAELMCRFYRHMLEGKHESPDSALRIAQIEMWKDQRWRQPYYWGAFVLHGEWK